jgi:hypothetical protein
MSEQGKRSLATRQTAAAAATENPSPAAPQAGARRQSLTEALGEVESEAQDVGGLVPGFRSCYRGDGSGRQPSSRR